MVSIISAIGGIGFFLLGMNMMAEGLKTIAGDSLRNLLNRFTGGTVSSIATGAFITLLVQSSTATSLMTIGFVSAGMLTFLQATGVIFGANLGTTSTGWMVALIGLKFSVSQLALPLIGIGMLLKQFSSGRWSQIGYILTGFGLIFVGIQYLQEGMAGLNEYIDFTLFSELGILNRLILIIIGIIMTIIMQSSSAAVATTITVLSAGTIGLEQAIALVIGQNIGTTATIAFASIGASVSAKRTALAHIFFNLLTGGITFIFFPFIIAAIRGLASRLSWEDPLIIVALFHTFFSILGIVILAPFIKQFTNFIIRLLPEKKSDITKHLDSSIISIPAVATETAMRALKEAAIQTLETTSLKAESLSSGLPSSHPEITRYNEDLKKIQLEIEEIKDFVMAIRTDTQETTARYTSLLHAIDHLERMSRLTIHNLSEVKLTNPLERIYPVVFQMEELILESIEGLQNDSIESVVPKLSTFSQELAEFRKKERAGIFEVTAKGDVQINEAFQYVKLILLVDGITHHLWRIMHHISEGNKE
jgi:phosphate:Na+ symporter